MSVLSREDLAARLQTERAGRTVVFTNGVYDILHAGHVHTLEAARAMGDILVVGLNSDASTRRLKGDKRPIVPEAERATLMDALKPVDYVVLFEEDNPIATIEALKPDIHVKGGDYDAETLPETPAVRAYGGRVAVVPFLQGLSTTDIIATIRARYGENGY